MKRQHYVIPALMLLTGVAWSGEDRGHYSSNPYAGYGGTPYNPNAPQLYGRQGHYPEPSYSPYTPNTTLPPYRHYNHPHSAYSNSTPYGVGNPYTPYTSPNPYKFNGNPYAADSISTPYNDSLYRARNPYRAYGGPYTATYPYATDPQQLYHSHGSYPGALSYPNSASPLYGPYGNPYSPDSFNTPYETGNPYER